MHEHRLVVEAGYGSYVPHGVRPILQHCPALQKPTHQQSGGGSERIGVHVDRLGLICPSLGRISARSTVTQVTPVTSQFDANPL
jgi:hypothetical protein